ncbi:MAG: IclR family transcriptional regulator [Alphaproteobacteria bacterium]|nr:IclR family transcriptional regulator [Alphaproteobacteria bacterium]
MNTEVKSAARVLELLELLARCPAPIALKDVVATLGIPKSSAHGLLQTLVARGYAERDGTDRYAFHESLRQSPGWVGGSEAQLLALAQPIMDQLRDELGETVFLGVRGARGDVKALGKAASRAPIRYDADLVGLRPAYCTAMGRVLLAWWDPASTEAYLTRTKLRAYTANTVTDRQKLHGLLAQVRLDGYAVLDQEYVLGGTATAAPVLHRDGTVAAALNVGTVSSRYPQAKRQIIAAVIRAAGRISQRLGYRKAA